GHTLRPRGARRSAGSTLTLARKDARTGPSAPARSRYRWRTTKHRRRGPIERGLRLLRPRLGTLDGSRNRAREASLKVQNADPGWSNGDTCHLWAEAPDLFDPGFALLLAGIAPRH